MKKFLYSLILLLILLPQVRAFAQVSSDGTMSYNWPLVSAGATGQSVQLGGAIHTDTYTNPTPIAELEIRLHVSENPFSDTQAALTLVGDQSQVVGKVSLDSGAASGVEAGTGQYYFQVSGLSPDKTYYCRQVILQKDTQTVLDVNNSNCKFDGGHGIIPENSKLAQTLEDEKTYHFLAPLPGLDKLYDPDLCYQKKYVERSIPENSICDVGGFVSFVFKLFIGLSALVLVLRIMYEGYQYIVTDVPFLKANAKSDLMTALAGLLLALSAYVILNTINPKLVNNSFSISGVNLGVESTFTSGGGTFTGGTATPNANTNITTYDAFLHTAATQYEVEYTLAKAHMYAESGGNPNATSDIKNKSGTVVNHAYGLMQLTRPTFESLGYDFSKIYDPKTNIEAGVKYMAKLKTSGCNGSTSNTVCTTSDVSYRIAAYNGGAGANKPSNSCPGKTQWQCDTVTDGYAETRNYVAKVLANQQKIIQKNW